ncbi:MAG TPA: ScpA family protein [Gammaproteobacteria bacterium]|nr:ScpA family protein [Gammaproteobacteria bacterium]
MTEQTPTATVLVRGHAMTELPHDLYIPPEAMEVFLETFQGPLDLLLYLIKKENLDILNIPVAEITKQYIQYVELMKTLNLELAAEYLVMAALLAEIKSRMLLPRPTELGPEEEDPRALLIRRLQEYEQIKLAAENLDKLPQVGRDIFLASVEVADDEIPKPKPELDMKDLMVAFLDVMQRVSHNAKHKIAHEPLSIRERMGQVLRVLKPDSYTKFQDLFLVSEGKMGVVVTFIAILELLKQSLIDIVQQEPYSPLHVKAAVA